MEIGRLVFNEQNGHYGIKYSNTNIWVNDGLKGGDDITLYDYNVDHWIEEHILSIPPANNPESWYLKNSGFRGTQLHNLSVWLDYAENPSNPDT